MSIQDQRAQALYAKDSRSFQFSSQVFIAKTFTSSRRVPRTENLFGLGANEYPVDKTHTSAGDDATEIDKEGEGRLGTVKGLLQLLERMTKSVD